MSGVLVINCPNQHLIYSSINFVKYSNRGVKDYGDNYQIQNVHRIVEKQYQGHVAYLDPKLKQGIKTFATSLGVESVEIFKFPVFSYAFSYRINNFVLYDMDYALFVFNESMLGYITTKGFPGESYTDKDIQFKLNTGTAITHLVGYSSTVNEVYKYQFTTVEKDNTNNQLLRTYELNPNTK